MSTIPIGKKCSCEMCSKGQQSDFFVARCARKLDIAAIYAIRLNGGLLHVIEKDQLLSQTEVLLYPNKQANYPRPPDSTALGILPAGPIMTILQQSGDQSHIALRSVSKEASFLTESAATYKDILCVF